MVELFNNVDVAVTVDGQSVGPIELSVFLAFCAPLTQEPPLEVEDLYPVVFPINHVDVAVIVNCQSLRGIELAVFLAFCAPLAQELIRILCRWGSSQEVRLLPANVVGRVHASPGDVGPTPYAAPGFSTLYWVVVLFEHV